MVQRGRIFAADSLFDKHMGKIVSRLALFILDMLSERQALSEETSPAPFDVLSVLFLFFLWGGRGGFSSLPNGP